MFFDLADPRKRSGEDVLEALELIQGFKKQGFCTVLGLNLKEARLIAGHICRSEEITSGGVSGRSDRERYVGIRVFACERFYNFKVRFHLVCLSCL